MEFTFHTIAEAASEFGIGKETLRKRIRSANLIPHKVGNIELVTGDQIAILKNMPEPELGRRPKRRI